MEKEILIALEDYKKYTMELISCLEKEDYDLLEEFINKRQEILDELSNSNYNKEEISKVSEELQLLSFQDKLNDLIIKKRDEVKQNMDRLAQSKSANNVYNKSGQAAKIFSQKV